MTIYYLMVKTHNTTGLKYLCQTKAKDPFKYKGSGKYWKLHIKKHGVDINTKILKECQTKNDLRNWGAYYSNLWNVVDSNEWANLMPELGDGATPGHKRTIKSILKGIETKRKNGTLTHSDVTINKMKVSGKLRAPKSLETIAKISETKMKDPTRFEKAKRAAATRKQNGYKPTLESIAKGLATRTARGSVGCSLEAVAKIVASRKANSSYGNTPEAVAKMVAARKANGSYKRTPESIAKQQATRLAKRTLRNQDNT
jgi:hypothetical protein